MLEFGSLKVPVHTYTASGASDRPSYTLLTLFIFTKMAAVTDHTPAPTAGIFQKATESASFVRSKLPSELQAPRVAIVCGSGLGGIASTINKGASVEIDYLDIPNFPKTTGEYLPTE